jgi:hypothetical protein
MPPTPLVVLEIDDSTTPECVAFSQDVSVWSFEHDLNLPTRTGAETFRTLHRVLGESKFRGYPDGVARATTKLFDRFVGPEEVTWLSGAELATARSHLPSGDSAVMKSLGMLFDVVEVAGRYFGPDRVRLVFTFI